MLSQIESYKCYQPINIHVLIETGIGMASVEEIAKSCPERMEAMVFGVADYAASVRARTTQIGGANPDYGMLTDPDSDGGRHYHWGDQRSEEHTSELQSHHDLVCRLLLEKKKKHSEMRH